MDYRERGSRARGVYPTQYTSRMRTVRVKQEKEADKNDAREYSKNSERKERGHEREKSQTRRETPYH